MPIADSPTHTKIRNLRVYRNRDGPLPELSGRRRGPIPYLPVAVGRSGEAAASNGLICRVKVAGEKQPKIDQYPTSAQFRWS